MPQVNLNRLYKVRSRERTPVPNPVSVPDAAGAYLRSVRPAQQAQLQSARARAELDNDKWRRIAQGIDTGIRSFEHTYDAYARARERQEYKEERERARQEAEEERQRRNQERIEAAAERERNARITKAMADAQEHFNRELPAAMQRRYVPGEGDKPVDGPLVGVEQVIADYFGSNLFQDLGDDIKDDVQAKVRQLTASDIGRATVQQAKMQQEDRAANIERLILSKEVRVANNLDDLPTWTDSVQELANEVENQLRTTSGYYDADGNVRPGTDIAGLDAQVALMREAAERKQNSVRLEWLASLVAQDLDPDGTREAELRAWMLDAKQYAEQESNEGGIRTDWHPTEETQLSDVERDNLSKKLRGALQERDSLRERRDADAQKAIVAEVADLIGKLDPATNTATTEETRRYTNEAAEAARQRAAAIRDDARREKALQQIDAAVGIQEVTGWQNAYEEALRRYQDGDAEWQEVSAIIQQIQSMESDAGKQAAAQIFSGAATTIAKDVTARFTDVMERGWYFDASTRQRVSVTQEEAIDLFQKWLPFMDREQREKAWKAFDASRPRLHRDDIETLDEWLGSNNATKLFAWEKIAASEDGKMVLAPDTEWDKDGRMDIKRGFGEVDIDREAARAIWQAALEFRRLKDAGIIKQVDGRYPTMREWLDEQVKTNDTLRNWRDMQTVMRIQTTLNALESMEESAFFNTPPVFAEPAAEENNSNE